MRTSTLPLHEEGGARGERIAQHADDNPLLLLATLALSFLIKGRLGE